VTYGLLRAAPHGYAATLLLDGTGTGGGLCSEQAIQPVVNTGMLYQ
jgi:hypothetical protein